MNASRSLDIIGFEKSLGYPGDDGVGIACFEQSELLEHGEGAFNDFCVSVSFRPQASLFGKKARPVLVENEEVGGQETPVAVRLKEAFFAEADNLVCGMKCCFPLNRKNGQRSVTLRWAKPSEPWRKVGPELQQLGPGRRLRQVLEFQNCHDVFGADCFQHSPVGKLRAVALGDMRTQWRPGLRIEVLNDLLRRPDVEEHDRNMNRLAIGDEAPGVGNTTSDSLSASPKASSAMVLQTPSSELSLRSTFESRS